jgi:seryl-tRNA synthetase
MHDIKVIRENPAAFDAGLARRGLSAQSAELLVLDEARRSRLTELQALQSKRNDVAKAIGAAMREDKAKAEALKVEAAEIKEKIAALEAATSDEAQDELRDALSRIPNIPVDDVPQGADESGNKEVRRWGEPKEIANAKEHFDLGEALGQMDFDVAAKIAGARFVVLSGQLARLERALASFMLDLHSNEFGYTEVVPPMLVRDNAVMGTAQLPKFAEDLFQTTDGRWLIPTAEVSLTNLVADEIVAEDSLPRRYTAYTPCFRSEAGSAGRDTRGMIRQHQFTKVELVSITRPEDSDAEHERMTLAAEEVLKRLGLPYRTMLLCTGDMGFSSRKTYDIEVWLPGQGKYREISSCSNCGDFQARRMNARYRAGEKDVRFVHTLNGSALAVGRTMVAILENYQQADGSIAIPEVLQPYMGGLKIIEKVK